MEKRTSNTTCQVCGTQFYKRPYALAKDSSHCCSIKCQNTLRTSRMRGEGNHQYGLKGELNSSFKGDWYITNYGYLVIKSYNHPFKRYDGSILAHRVVLEEYLKQNDPGSEHLIVVDDRLVLSPDVVVHHKDGNKLNNSIENLEIMYKGDHTRYHNFDLEYERQWDGSFKRVAYRKSGKGFLTKAHIADAGRDILSSEETIIYPDSWGKVSTGLQISIPIGFVGLIWSRSGLSLKRGIEVGAGCIDSGYTGEILVVLYNHSRDPFKVSPGDKIAQLLVVPISLESFEGDASRLTERGSRGFGSTDLTEEDS